MAAAEKKEPVAKPAGEKAAKGAGSSVGHCTARGCKANEKRFSFCDEHYDHFKFGLIKKNGDQVSDYEKKFEHYLAYKKKQGARKVA